MSMTEEDVPPEEETKPKADGTRRPPGPPRITGVDSPDEPEPFPVPPKGEILITRRGKPCGLITPKDRKRDGGQRGNQ